MSSILKLLQNVIDRQSFQIELNILTKLTVPLDIKSYNMPFVVPKLLNTNDNCYIIFMCTIHASNTSLIYKISVPRNSPEDPLCCPCKQHFIILSHQFSLISIDNFSINVSACKPTTPPSPYPHENCRPCGPDVHVFGIQQRHAKLFSSFLQYT